MSTSSSVFHRGIRFEWSVEKARINKRDHRVTFQQAIDAFFDERAVVLPDLTTEEGEERFHFIAATSTATVLLVVHTYKERHGETSIRIISARKATPREREFYHNANP